MEGKRLYRSERDRMLAGVCAGLGAYFGVDATLVRVVFVLLGLFSGTGVVLYLVMWVIVPSESRLGAPAQEVAREGFDDLRERARQGAGEVRAAVQRRRRREGQGPAGGQDRPGSP